MTVECQTITISSGCYWQLMARYQSPKTLHWKDENTSALTSWIGWGSSGANLVRMLMLSLNSTGKDS